MTCRAKKNKKPQGSGTHKIHESTLHTKIPSRWTVFNKKDFIRTKQNKTDIHHNLSKLEITIEIYPLYFVMI